MLRKASNALILHPPLSVLKSRVELPDQREAETFGEEGAKTVASLALIIYIGITSTT